MKGAFLTGISTEELAEKVARKVLDKIWKKSKANSSKKPDFLTAQETANLCKIKSLSTLWNWKRQGLLVPTSRAGRKPLYKYEDVIAFLEGRKTGSDDK